MSLFRRVTNDSVSFKILRDAFGSRVVQSELSVIYLRQYCEQYPQYA